MELFRLFGSILINSDEADKSLQKTDKHAESVGGTLAKGIGTAAKWGLGLATAATAGAGALFGMATKASEACANIDDVAQRTNLSAKTLQEFKHAAEMSGFSMDNIEGAAKKLTVTMGNYASGNKETINAFKQLGLSAEGTNGKLKSTDEMFPSIIGKLADMKDITERNALGVKFFGKSFMDMAPMLNDGSAGVKELTDEAHKMGLVMSDESVKAGAKFDDSLTLVKSSLGALVTKVGVEALPIVQSMLDWVTAHMPQIQAITSVAFDVIKVAVQAVGDFITNTLIPTFINLYNWIEPNIPAIKQTMQDTFELIKKVIDDVSTAIGIVIDWCIKYKDILIPLGAGITAAGIAFGIYTLVMEAVTLATTIATAASTAFGAVLAFITSPIGIVVIAIGLLVAAGVLLYKNWDVVRAKATEIFGAIGSFVGGVIDGIKSGFHGMVNGVISGLNFMIRALNKLKFTVPDWVPVIGGGGFGFNIPTIPSFAIGTKYLPDDMLIQAHEGEMIVPKAENPYANSGDGKTLPSGGFTLKIENFVNNRTQDVESLATELAFYMKQKNLGTGGAY